MNNAKKGLLISLILIILGLAIILTVNAIPNGEVNTLSLGEVRYNIEKSEIKTPNWKVACYIVSGLIMLLAVIIKFSLCRCPSCTRYINLMNIFTTHCPYCGKSLDKSK